MEKIKNKNMTSHYRIIEEKNPLTDDKYYKIQEKVLWFWLTNLDLGLYASAEDAERVICRLHPSSKRVVKTFAFTDKILWE